MQPADESLEGTSGNAHASRAWKGEEMYISYHQSTLLNKVPFLFTHYPPSSKIDFISRLGLFAPAIDIPQSYPRSEWHKPLRENRNLVKTITGVRYAEEN